MRWLIEWQATSSEPWSETAAACEAELSAPLSGGIIYLWSSGRLCDFKGCDTREDLKPLNINGWFWSGSNVKMAPTNATPPGKYPEPN